MCKKIYKPALSVAVIALLIAFMHLFSTSHDVWYTVMHNEHMVLANSQQFEPSRLTIVYERTHQSQHDLLQLQIDSLYRPIAKGNFSYKVVCDRRFTLKSFNGEQTIDMSDQAATCFINGNTPHKWTTSQQSCSIQQVNCQQATANIDGQLYEAWYSMALPHCYHNAEPCDPCNGLIMELHSMSDDYSLKIKYIEQHIG
jgi:GLPGLI family protein